MNLSFAERWRARGNAFLNPIDREKSEILRKRWHSVYDDTASIGRLYRRQDEVGTPFCITVDVQTVGDDKSPADGKVTIRDRDSMGQVRVAMSSLPAVMEKLMAGEWPEVYREQGVAKD